MLPNELTGSVSYGWDLMWVRVGLLHAGSGSGVIVVAGDGVVVVGEVGNVGEVGVGR